MIPKKNCFLIMLAVTVLWLPAKAQIAPTIDAPWPALKRITLAESSTAISIRLDSNSEKGLEIARAYNANTIVWSYISNKELINRAFAAGITSFQGTINSNVKTAGDSGAARDIDNKPLIAPWMQSWGAIWVTTNEPTTVSALKAQITNYANVGASSLQIDDPTLQEGSLQWGGDFSQGSLSEFTKYIKNTPQNQLPIEIRNISEDWNYKTYLQNKYNINSASDYRKKLSTIKENVLWNKFIAFSVEKYYSDLTKWMSETFPQGRPFISMNLNNLSDAAANTLKLAKYADYLVSETNISERSVAILNATIARSMGLRYFPAIIPGDQQKTRSIIATYFAMGDTPVIPSDVFMVASPGQTPTRYFPPSGAFEDIYHNVRAQADAYDHWVPTASIGVCVKISNLRKADFRNLVLQLANYHISYILILLDDDTEQPIFPTGNLSNLKAFVADPELNNNFILKINTNGNSSTYVTKSWATMNQVTLAELSPLKSSGESDNKSTFQIGAVSRSDFAIHLALESPVEVPIQLDIKPEALCGANEALTTPPLSAATATSGTTSPFLSKAADKVTLTIPKNEKNMLYSVKYSCH